MVSTSSISNAGKRLAIHVRDDYFSVKSPRLFHLPRSYQSHRSCVTLLDYCQYLYVLFQFQCASITHLHKPELVSIHLEGLDPHPVVLLDKGCVVSMFPQGRTCASLCGQLCSPTPYSRKAVTLGRGDNDPDQWSLRDSMSLLFSLAPLRSTDYTRF